MRTYVTETEIATMVYRSLRITRVFGALNSDGGIEWSHRFNDVIGIDRITSEILHVVQKDFSPIPSTSNVRLKWSDFFYVVATILKKIRIYLSFFKTE